MSGSDAWSLPRPEGVAFTAGTNSISFGTLFVTITFHSPKAGPTTIPISFRPATSATTGSAASSLLPYYARRLKSGSTASLSPKRSLTSRPRSRKKSWTVAGARTGATARRSSPRSITKNSRGSSPTRSSRGTSWETTQLEFMARAEQIAALKKELAEVRAASMEATRRGDFMKVARCTSQAAQLNRAIMEAESFQEAARTGANPNEAARR